MRMNVANTKPRKVQVQFHDAAGNPAKVQGAVSWKCSNSSIATVAAMRPDTTIALVSPVGPSGTFQVSATADADLGDGVRKLTVELDMRVVGGGQAVGGEIVPVSDGYPDQSLPGSQPGIDNSLPGSQPGPDQTLPGLEAPVDPGYGVGIERPDQSLPGSQPGIDNSLPGDQPHPDQGLPGAQPGIDNSLPGAPPVVDNSLPPGVDNSLPGSQPGVDNSLPGDQPGVDNSLPGDQPEVDNTLPPHKQPKR